MDEEGEYIQAYVYLRRQIRFYDRSIHEGQWKSISNFIVFDDDREEPNTMNDYAIKICENTVFLDTHPLDVEEHIGYDTFEHILEVESDLDLPTATLGFVVAGEDLKTVDDERDTSVPRKKTASLDFTIRDDKGLLLNCLALGKLAVDINDKICGGPGMAVFCFLTHWSIKTRDGGRYLKIRGGISRLDLDPVFPDAVAFSERFWARRIGPFIDLDDGSSSSTP